MNREEKREENIRKLNMAQDLISQGMSSQQATKKAGFSSNAYYYQVRKRYGLAPVESAREVVAVPTTGNSQELKMLRIENQRLRMIVSDYALDIQALKEYSGRK